MMISYGGGVINEFLEYLCIYGFLNVILTESTVSAGVHIYSIYILVFN